MRRDTGLVAFLGAPLFVALGAAFLVALGRAHIEDKWREIRRAWRRCE